MFAEDALLFCGRRPCWELCRSSRVGRADKGGAGDVRIFLGRKDELEVAVLTSANVALDGCCVHCQELMCLLDGGIVRLSRVIDE